MGSCASTRKRSSVGPLTASVVFSRERGSTFLPVTSRNVWPETGGFRPEGRRRKLFVTRVKQYNSDVVWFEVSRSSSMLGSGDSSLDSGGSSVSRNSRGSRRRAVLSENDLTVPSTWFVTVHVNIDGGRELIRTATPISSGPNHMTFLMRIFPNTEIGRFLSNLQVADEVSVYGPLPSRVAFSANDGIASLVTSARVSQSDLAQSEQVNLKCSSVVLLAQGTGITTFVQLIERSLMATSSNVVIRLVHVVKTEADFLLQRELRMLAAQVPGRLVVVRVAERLAMPMPRVVVGKFDEDMLARVIELPLSSNTLVLVSGSRRFNMECGLWLARSGVASDRVSLIPDSEPLMSFDNSVPSADALVAAVAEQDLPPAPAKPKEDPRPECSAAPSLPIISASMVAARQDWIVVDGFVIDMATFKDRHPGGLETSGKRDASAMFLNTSSEAHSELLKLAVGILDDDDGASDILAATVTTLDPLKSSNSVVERGSERSGSSLNSSRALSVDLVVRVDAFNPSPAELQLINTSPAVEQLTPVIRTHQATNSSSSFSLFDSSSEQREYATTPDSVYVAAVATTRSFGHVSSSAVDMQSSSTTASSSSSSFSSSYSTSSRRGSLPRSGSNDDPSAM
ncbi:uncharacterized protein AMSG_02531 [Thecamonas trahens ATCC 50062]|uniref:Cytochrome b5 heme-binding domain-containing protein n=1 Tax=Thecamonas trahens ATCC 50062 TaxID=461836 RepID=A0A0L0D605_THETB|nr:hypothetical protein AMSG_02531 [Thecamonas trahens ATCC 50062]KNC47511.1 hypothetical protein AMSG_02531 [Thecamonas trahens ATCC 50062]|eukprot:XP_013759445.1 hypothetical protein AMSG_02531 [Thecamonas trahens ATCC 50062]